MGRILIVDDENNIRMMTRLTLEHDGHTVSTAADGQEALKQYGEGLEWDLVLLDQRMPGLEGLDVLREMRRRNPTAQIIMATAFGTIDLAVDAMKAGATDFIRKPFSTETLRGAVSAAVHSIDRVHEECLTFGLTTINGYRIEWKSNESRKTPDGFETIFTVRNPADEVQSCTVLIVSYVMELVRAHVDRDQMPGGERFWQGLCEETLANYLWQNAAFPPEGALTLKEFTGPLKRWVDSVLTIRE